MSTVRSELSRLVALSVLVAALAVSSPPVLAQACEFQLGFKTLHDLIPEIVGDCVADEWHNPDNGDALQQTTRGLMVWRQADNWTAFTDGSTTWINGPFGLQSRPNDQRFSWEPIAVPSPTTAQPPAAAPPAPAPGRAAEPGSVRKWPAEIVLGLGEMGKEIRQTLSKEGTDRRGRWMEVRFARDARRLDAEMGPIQIYNKVVVAVDIPTAQAIYQAELARQAKMPEATERVGPLFRYDPGTGPPPAGDEMDSLAACNADCGSKAYSGTHVRTVMRYQNAVTILYFYGGRESATPLQAAEWLVRLRERMD